MTIAGAVASAAILARLLRHARNDGGAFGRSVGTEFAHPAPPFFADRSLDDLPGEAQRGDGIAEVAIRAAPDRGEHAGGFQFGIGNRSQQARQDFVADQCAGGALRARFAAVVYGAAGHDGGQVTPSARPA